MKVLSKKCETVQASKIRIMFNRAMEMEECINLSIGEPDFSTPAHIVNAAANALINNKTRYTANAGMQELRMAIEDHVFVEYKLPYSWKSEIIVTTGGVQALYLAMMALLEPGDEVIISEPYWGNHLEQIRLCGAVPVFVPVYEQDGFVYSIDNLEKAVTERTKVLLICSPANPTGCIIGSEALEGIANFALRHDLYVISDDVYSRIIYDGVDFKSIASYTGMKERTLIINSFSKAYAMTGWRVGYTLGPEMIINNMVKFQENVVSCVNTPAQYGALEALRGDQSIVNQMRDVYQERRDMLVNGINKINGIHTLMPKGAFYVFANIQACGMDSWKFAIKLLEEEGVVVVPGEAFGASGDGFIRISYATSKENIEKSLEKLDGFIKRSRA